MKMDIRAGFSCGSTVGGAGKLYRYGSGTGP